MEFRVYSGVYLALLHIFLLPPVRCRDFPHHLFQSLMKGYNKEEWPSYQDGDKVPTRVYVEIYIVSISSISAESMDFVVDFLLTQHWKDPRLRFSENVSKVLELHQLRQIKKLWLPDPYIINAKSAYFHEITLPNRFARITTQGNITYNARLTAKMSCQMQLRLYPMDTQTCEIYLESYGYSTDILYFHWHWIEKDAFTMAGDLELPNFMNPEPEKKECVDEYTMGYFSCLKVRLKLRRRISYHLTQTYLPTFLIVSISWVTFWLSVEAVPARVSLGITTLLTMTTLISGAKQGLPAVSYIKALDVWMGTCTFFVFSTLLEYVIVSKTSRKKVVMLVPMKNSTSSNTNHVPRSQTMSPTAPFEHHYSPQPPPTGNAKSPSQVPNHFRPHKLSIPPQNGSFEFDPESPPGDTYKPGPTRTVYTPAQQAKRIDVISRVLFPSLFAAFNFVYWTYYLLQSAEEAL